MLRLLCFRVAPMLLLFLFAGPHALVERPAEASPLQQPARCAWKDVGNIDRAVSYSASAMDTDNNVMYVYGGSLDSGAGITNLVNSITFGATLTRSDTKPATESIAAAQEISAHSGVYRSKGEDSAIYWIAGRNRTKATNGVQVFKIASKQWSTIQPTGTFGDRNEHVAAYDPKHDVIWVAGGDSATCPQVPCAAPQLPTNYLAFDAVTGASSWHDGPSGGPRAKGPSMVYDSKKERMIFFGGTIDGTKGTDQLYALDLSDPDVTKARWAPLRASGSGPSVAVHQAAYDANLNRMIVYGGMRTDYAVRGSETAESRTFALDLSVDPPVWRNLNATTGELIQGVMEYVPKHKAVVMTAGRGALPDPLPSSYKFRAIIALECSIAAVPTATNTPAAATPTRTPGGAEPTAVPVPTLDPSPVICEAVKSRVPPAVLNAAVTAPDRVSGYGQPCNANLAPSALNPLRRYLTLQNTGVPFHPIFNNVIWKCGCQ